MFEDTVFEDPEAAPLRALWKLIKVCGTECETDICRNVGPTIEKLKKEAEEYLRKNDFKKARMLSLELEFLKKLSAVCPVK